VSLAKPQKIAKGKAILVLPLLAHQRASAFIGGWRQASGIRAEAVGIGILCTAKPSLVVFPSKHFHLETTKDTKSTKKRTEEASPGDAWRGSFLVFFAPSRPSCSWWLQVLGCGRGQALAHAKAEPASQRSHIARSIVDFYAT
jgi:hypothetical protein